MLDNCAPYFANITSTKPRPREPKTNRDSRGRGVIQRAAKVLQRVQDVDYVKLSIAAKTYFVLGKKQGKSSIPELTELAREFGWSVSPQEVQKAAEILGALDLVEVGSGFPTLSYLSCLS